MSSSPNKNNTSPLKKDKKDIEMKPLNEANENQQGQEKATPINFEPMDILEDF